MYGMSEALGLMHCAQRQSQFLPAAEGQLQRGCSDDTERAIDAEVKKILGDAYADARKILVDHREKLEAIARELMEKETIDRTSFENLLGPEQEQHGRASRPSAN